MDRRTKLSSTTNFNIRNRFVINVATSALTGIVYLILVDISVSSCRDIIETRRIVAICRGIQHE